MPPAKKAGRDKDLFRGDLVFAVCELNNGSIWWPGQVQNSGYVREDATVLFFGDGSQGESTLQKPSACMAWAVQQLQGGGCGNQEQQGCRVSSMSVLFHLHLRARAFAAAFSCPQRQHTPVRSPRGLPLLSKELLIVPDTASACFSC